MAVDLRYANDQISSLSSIDLDRTNPTFLQTVGSQLRYSYAPIIDTLSNAMEFGNVETDLNYDPRPDMEGYEDYFDTLVHAKNAEHMSILKNQITSYEKNREVLAEAGFWKNLGAGFLDPVNLVALPFGGPTVGVAKSMLRGGAAAGLIQTGLEGLRVPFDPVATKEEAAINIGTTAVFGSMLSGAISVPITRRSIALKKTEQSHKEYMEAIGASEDVEKLTPADILGKRAREERSLASSTDEDLNIAIEAENRNIFGIEKRVEEIETELKNLDDLSNEQIENLVDELDSLARNKAQSESTIKVTRHERALRQIEDAGMDDAYDIAPNIFINSPLFKLVTTPMKRVLQSDVVNTAKKSMLQLAGDSGLALVMNKFGLSIGPSVYQTARIMEGEWVQVDRQLKKLWSETLGQGEGAGFGLGINSLDLVERFHARPQFLGGKKTGRTYGEWLESVNEKRIKGVEGLTDQEQNAVNTLNNFYLKNEKRLREIGLLGDSQNIKRKIETQDYNLKKVREKLAAWEEKRKAGKLRKWEESKKKNALDITRMYERKIIRLTEAKEENELMLQFIKDYEIMPPNETVHFPRYWNVPYIKKNRSKLERVISDWFEENNTIIVKENGKLVRKELPKDKESRDKRAKEAVDNILGIKDILDPDSVNYGFGKSKHLRHRQLDIPNSLVYDFIIKDPIAVMKVYTNKTSATYQFHKMFNNRSVVEVLDDIEEEMLLAGNSEIEINKFRRDFKGMYDRIVGSPTRNFDRIDFKMAQVSKDLAYVNYLGSSGFSAIPDFARIIMEHELGDVVKGLTSILDQDIRGMNRAELDAIAEAVEILQGSAHVRFTDNMTNNPLQSSTWDSMRSVYNVANLLGPMTQIAKTLDGLIRGHTLVKLSKKWAANDPKDLISQQDVTYLARYNITEEIAKEIAAAPTQLTERGLYLPNTAAWTNTIKFPEHTAKIITGPTNRTDKNGNYVAAFYNNETKTIRIDEDYIRDVMWPNRSFENPRVEGVKPIEKGVINSEDDLVQFVKMHEIMHNKYRPKQLGTLKEVEVEGTVSKRIRVKKFDLEKSLTDDSIIESMPKAKQSIAKKLLEEYQIIRNSFAVSKDLKKMEKRFQEGYDKFVKSLPKTRTTKVKGKVKQKVTDQAAYENAINDLAVKEIKSQQRVKPETTETFRTALQSGILNTIMQGTPADKPLITDGVVYVPHRIAKVFGYEEDEVVKGYARMESGILGLPFQFYSYSLAAMNKVTGAYSQGQIKNRMAGVLSAMGLGYLSIKIKSKLSDGAERQWEEMSQSDRFIRAFDQSGLLALYSDLMYTSINTSMALGKGNYLDGVVAPKFPQEEDYLDAFTGIAGAGPSIISDLTIDPARSFLNGEEGDAVKQFWRSLPFMRLWFWKNEMNGMSLGLARQL